MLRYYRNVDSLSRWKAGREARAIPSRECASAYLRELKRGTGFPSLWLAETDEDLEKIALGILLRKGHLDNIRLVGFNQECFSEVGVNVEQVIDHEFPVITVCHLHYELLTLEDAKLEAAIEIFLKGSGDFKEFFKANLKFSNMRSIAAKHINEVSEIYKKKAKEWGQISS